MEKNYLLQLKKFNMKNKSPEEYADFLLNSFFFINDEEKSKLGAHPFIDREYAKECALLCIKQMYDFGSINRLREELLYLNEVEKIIKQK